MDSNGLKLYKYYSEEKKDIAEIDSFLCDIISIFYNFDSELGWEYEIENQSTSFKTQENLSYSTCSMILHSILSGLGELKDSEISRGISDRNNIKTNSRIKPEQISKLENVYRNIFKAIINEYATNGNNHFSSFNFGKDDPLTFSWFLEILFYVNNHDTELKSQIDRFSHHKNRLIRNAINQVSKTLQKPNIGCFEYDKTEKPTRKPLNHALPILRTINILSLLNKNSDYIPPTLKNQLAEIEKELIPVITQQSLNRIHRHLSLFSIEDSEFDVAELVLSFETYLLSRGKVKTVDINLVNKIFEIVKESQAKSAYWRPLKPFVITSSGFALLPLSIEIVNSLLRICTLIRPLLNQIDFFSEYISIFKRYMTWLKNRIVYGNCVGKDNHSYDFAGWHSENVLEPNKVHTWDTSQVMLFLLLFQSALQTHISRMSLRSANLLSQYQNRKDSPDSAPHEYWINHWQKNEPLKNIGSNSKYAVLKNMGIDFLKRRVDGADPKRLSFSMLLYGPPGTGKSSIAEELAASLKWNLITITPSDFIAKGESEVNNRSDEIFSALMEQDNCVVLFDEIDRLILDRESRFYLQQGDIFQFMTPGMLVRIRNLRKKKNCIFIIATNYADRIDSAIKRAGRIDKKYLIAPPNKTQRLEIVKALLKDKTDIDEATIDSQINDRALDRFLTNSVFFKYGEIKNFLEAAIYKDLSGRIDIASLLTYLNDSNNFDASELSLSSYSERFEIILKEKNKEFLGVQEPYDEFLVLYYMANDEGKKDEFADDMFKKILKDLDSKFSTQTTASSIRTTLKKTLRDPVIERALLEKYEELNR